MLYRAIPYSLCCLAFGGHAEVALHLSLIHTVDGDPGEVAADHQSPHRVTHARTRVKTGKHADIGQYSLQCEAGQLPNLGSDDVLQFYTNNTVIYIK